VTPERCLTHLLGATKIAEGERFSGFLLFLEEVMTLLEFLVVGAFGILIWQRKAQGWVFPRLP
jgi:hypothetical protein